MSNLTIAVFDSGVGGLTVARAIVERLPGVRLRYLGDTARLPYGTKSSKTVVRYALQAAAALLDQPADALVVACNTASACALDELRDRFTIPIIGVIEPGAAAAVAATRSGHIGVIGTERTIESEAYNRAIRALDTGAQVHGLATPLLVGLAEQGWFDHPVTDAALDAYLTPWVTGERAGIDTIVLGCTHYPALKVPIQRAVDRLFCRPIALVDSAVAIAEDLGRRFGEQPGAGTIELLATDELARFSRVGRCFFDLDRATLRVVDL